MARRKAPDAAAVPAELAERCYLASLFGRLGVRLCGGGQTPLFIRKPVAEAMRRDGLAEAVAVLESAAADAGVATDQLARAVAGSVDRSTVRPEAMARQVQSVERFLACWDVDI